MIGSTAYFLISISAMLAAADDSAGELLRQALDSWKAGRTEAALTLASRAAEAAPGNPKPALVLGQFHDALGKHSDAIADFDRCIKLDPAAAEAYDYRGSAQFKLGHFREAIADFDKFIALNPAEAKGHWRRGIALYYAGRYADGRDQFKGYETVDTNDVENAVWHFLCNAKADGVDKARANLLKVGKDRRVPMMEVYELFAGRIEPAGVLVAAESDKTPAAERATALFYAHLYLGLYFDANGNSKKALEHMELAAGKYRSRQYMGDVARVHAQVLRDAAAKK